eukprot:gene11210-15041_t
MSTRKDYDYLFKLVLIGDNGVGKSALLLRFAENTFSEIPASSATIGVDFKFRILKVEKKTVKLQIWDTAGQERFKTITSAYYRGADGIIMIYDITNHDSFRHMNEWFQEVNRYASESCVKLIVANKIDLENRVISINEGKTYAQSLNLPFIETSASDGTNVEEAFQLIAQELVRVKTNSSSPKSRSSTSSNTTSSAVNTSNIVLTENEDKSGNAKSKKSSCC